MRPGNGIVILAVNKRMGTVGARLTGACLAVWDVLIHAPSPAPLLGMYSLRVLLKGQRRASRADSTLPWRILPRDSAPPCTCGGQKPSLLR